MDEKTKSKFKEYLMTALFVVLFAVCICISAYLLILFFNIPIIFSLIISFAGWLLIFLMMLKL